MNTYRRLSLLKYFFYSVSGFFPNILLHAAEAPAYCVRFLELAPSQRVTLATVVANELNFYQSKTVNVAGFVITADGSNRLAEIWLQHSDFTHFGTNDDLKNGGSVIDLSERVGIWGKGMAEIRAHAGPSKTQLCLCTVANMDDQNGNTAKRKENCMQRK